MRKILSALLVATTVAGAAAAACADDGFLDFEDRGGQRRERRYDAPPPPPPPVRRAAPPSRVSHGAQGEPYISVLGGGFVPSNDGADGLPDYDSAGAIQLGFGSRVSPVFAVEGTVGGYSAERGSDEANVVPITIGGRLIIPNPFFEPYFGGGGGLYLASLKEHDSAGNIFIDDEQAAFGGYFSMGADIWFNEHLALNLEGRHHWVNPEFKAVDGTRWDVEMSGWTFGAGIRFTF
ncbi:MAG TPA: outer membrane beta-barrel protein [Candidatus Deferrimicrobiaceae bacterium]